MADASYHRLLEDPWHPSLQFKRIGLLWSVRVGLHYRALAVQHEADAVGSGLARTRNTNRLIGKV
jgi:hypothetical protein